MTFSTLTFLLAFLPALLIIYFIIPKRFIALRNAVLLIFSLFFYAWGEPVYVLLIAACIFLTYLCCFGVVRKNKFMFILAILVNLLPLVFFKYTDFILLNISSFSSALPLSLGIIMPIGISFYTFQALSYVFDLYRGNVKLQKNPAYLALYVFFFPQLIAGPIVRYADVEAEIRKRESTPEGIVEGARRFIIGLAKKMLIANQAGYVVSVIQAQDPAAMGAGILWVSVLAYGVQILFDFSAYSDMAIGLGRIFGFNFLENFNKPYVARSVTDFWRRWHISLSSFFRDYIYIPLGGSRVGPVRHIFNLFVVWALTGLWHGAFWNYVMWGLYYFVLLALEKLVFGKLLSKAPALIARAITFFLFMFGWAIFMTETNSLNELGEFLGMLLGIVPSVATKSLRSLGLLGSVIVSFVGLLFSLLPTPAIFSSRGLPPNDKERLRKAFTDNGEELMKQAVFKTGSDANAKQLLERVIMRAKREYNPGFNMPAWLFELMEQEYRRMLHNKPLKRTTADLPAVEIMGYVVLLILFCVSVLFVVGESFNPFIYFRF